MDTKSQEWLDAYNAGDYDRCDAIDEMEKEPEPLERIHPFDYRDWSVV